MKKILFTLHRMDVGGVEKAFLGMLESLPHDDLEVHAAFIAPEGGFMKYLPSWVHVHPITPYYDNVPFMNRPLGTTFRRIMRGDLSGLRMFAEFVKSKFTGSKDSLCRFMLRNDDALGMEFDLAVNYSAPHEYLDYYVGHHVKARRRATWIHFDVSKAYVNKKSVLSNISRSDCIFIVSDLGRQIFNKRFPSLASKTVTFTNLISPESIKRDSLKPSGFKRIEGALNIVTVGRINPEKGQDLAIAAVALLNEMGIKAVLHLVGAGRNESACLRLAYEMGIKDFVRFYGSQTNPYPYMANADIYLQPSIHEGYCITLAEAKMFGAPIVATDFTGAREQLSSRPNAVIASDFTPEAIAGAIAKASKLPRCESLMPEPTDNMKSFLELL
ncbi:MAG: glycosyltransferase [Muribaculaceae bacterium]|nr:glycosyltransferase [Muribaculaceae bacterium]